jgi:hypothetical protein
MREDWSLVEQPQLRVFLEYKYLTSGEMGNILTRLQAYVRSQEGLGRQEYVKELQGRPRFVVSSLHTKDSVELALAVAGIVLMLTQPLWYDFAKRAWTRLIANVYFFLKGGLPGHRHAGVSQDEFETKLVRGTEEDLRITADLNRLDKKQRKKLATFVRSIISAGNRVHIKDEETELVIIRRARKKSGRR